MSLKRLKQACSYDAGDCYWGGFRHVDLLQHSAVVSCKKLFVKEEGETEKRERCVDGRRTAGDSKCVGGTI